MVSVIIPLYNAKKYICEAVASALSQAYVKEILVVDDNSTDGSAEYLMDWLNIQHPAASIPVLVIRNEKNQGVAQARNIGVKNATAKYVAFLDADDRFVEGKLEKQVVLLEKTDACLCNTARILIQEDGTQTGKIIHTPERITRKQMEKTNLITCSSVVAKREVMQEYPMEHSEWHEDYLTWLRLLRKYEFVIGIDEPLVEYRLTENGKSRNKIKSAYMTYWTYRCAGYPILKSCFMLCMYMLNGLKKYKFNEKFTGNSNTSGNQ